MKREIKFRLWSGTKMFYDIDNVMECLKQQLAFDNKLTFPIPYDHVGIDGSSFMQYTGLKDKNSKEIYEGDIITCHTEYERSGDEYDFEENPIEVSFDKRSASFFPLNLNNRWRCDLVNIEIVGNIYENPDLPKW